MATIGTADNHSEEGLGPSGIFGAGLGFRGFLQSEISLLASVGYSYSFPERIMRVALYPSSSGI